MLESFGDLVGADIQNQLDGLFLQRVMQSIQQYYTMSTATLKSINFFTLSYEIHTCSHSTGFTLQNCSVDNIKLYRKQLHEFSLIFTVLISHSV